MKKCSRCERPLPFSAFHMNSYSRDGYQSACIACRRYRGDFKKAVSRDRRGLGRGSRRPRDCYGSGHVKALIRRLYRFSRLTRELGT